MILFSDTQEVASRFGDSIEDLHDVFRCNGVDFGSSEDFFAFARTLKYHSELRDDVARVTKIVMASEAGISLRTMLTIIAVASGGPDVAASDREMSVPINLVIEALVSAGACSRLHTDHPDIPCSELASSDLGGTATLSESLSRLEMGSLQLKSYLDSIDERINRIEPRLKNDQSSSKQEVRTGTGPQPMLLRRWMALSQLDLRRRPALPVLAGVATLLAAAAFFWWFARDPGLAARHPLNASAGNLANAGGSPLTPGAASAVGNSPVVSVRGQQSDSTPTPTAQGLIHQDTTVQPFKKKSAQIHFRSSPQSSSLRTVPAEASPRPDTSEDAASPDRTFGLSSEPGSNHLVNVSSGVMEANLVSGPKPSYPILASLAHMQGNVVMQAVISKDGTVEHLEVIKGHHLLRGAAKNAVRNWRYRPYKIDGVPVEVATTVTVDFNGHR